MLLPMTHLSGPNNTVNFNPEDYSAEHVLIIRAVSVSVTMNSSPVLSLVTVKKLILLLSVIGNFLLLYSLSHFDKVLIDFIFPGEM